MRYKERQYTKRSKYLKELRNTLKEIGTKNVIYLDESGFDMRDNYKDSGWARLGKKIYGERTGNRFANKRQSLLMGKRGKDWLAPFIFEGTCNTELFNEWLKVMLIPELKKYTTKQVVIMDNASIHKNKKTRQLIEEAGHILLFLPPYSPDFNPIEKIFGVIKRTLKNCSKDISLEDVILSR